MKYIILVIALVCMLIPANAKDAKFKKHKIKKLKSEQVVAWDDNWTQTYQVRFSKRK